MHERHDMRKMEPWALGITIVIIVFLVVTVVGTIILSREHVNMVTPDYYEKDRSYQQRYEMLERTKQLAVKPTVTYDASTRTCVLAFADSSAVREVSGEVHFFRASDSRADVARTIALDAAGTQRFSAAELAQGLWTVKVNWSRTGLTYYLEERIYVQ